MFLPTAENGRHVHAALLSGGFLPGSLLSNRSTTCTAGRQASRTVLINDCLDVIDTVCLFSCPKALQAHTTEPLQLVLQGFTQMSLWVFGSLGQGIY